MNRKFTFMVKYKQSEEQVPVEAVNLEDAWLKLLGNIFNLEEVVSMTLFLQEVVE